MVNKNLLPIAGMIIDVSYYQECDEFVTINGVSTPLQDWVISDYYTQEILKDSLNKIAKRKRDYCLNMWNYVFCTLKPFYIQPTTDLGFMYKHYVYNGMIFCICFQYNKVFSITKYKYEQTTKM
jgi:hypothetical protein